MTNHYFRLLALIIAPTFGFAQKQATLDSLKSELSRTKSELHYQREKANRLEYLLASKEMAIRSIELKDSLYQALVAVQAYKFNLNHNGMADIDIFRAMYLSLKRFNDPIITTLFYNTTKSEKALPKKMKEMADKLCSKMKRNMTVEQWNMMASHLPYEATCMVK